MCKMWEERVVKHRKNPVVVLCLTFVLLLSACGSRENSLAENDIEESELQETKQSLTLDVSIGENTYTLRDNATVKELVKRMPKELVMNEQSFVKVYIYVRALLF